MERDLGRVVEAILARRSVRRFQAERPVEPWKRDAILAAATAAPSAKGRRPFRFLVLDDRGLLDELAEGLAQGEVFRQAPLAVAVCADLSGYPEGSLGWLEDCAAALENMLIAATSLGLGSLWFGVYRRAPKENVVRSVLEVPAWVQVHGIGVFGYGVPSELPRDDVDHGLVRYGRWTQGG